MAAMDTNKKTAKSNEKEDWLGLVCPGMAERIKIGTLDGTKNTFLLYARKQVTDRSFCYGK